jgi:signal transduction histidine kinase
VVQLAFRAPRKLSESEADLLKTAAEYAGSALARLDNEVLFRQSSMSLLQLEEIERKRISRDLHDDAAQSLAVIRLQLEMIEMSAPPESDDLRARLAEAREVAEKTIISMRRMISDLSPAILEQLGLAAAVRQLANRLRTSAGCNVTLEICSFAPLQPYKQLVLYRVVQQCFANIAQHSFARNINLSLSEADGVLRLDVEDDGVGFSVQERLGHPECFGLQGMRDRVYLIGGKFLVESTPKGKTRSTKSRSGTRISVEVPADK